MNSIYKYIPHVPKQYDYIADMPFKCVGPYVIRASFMMVDRNLNLLQCAGNGKNIHIDIKLNQNNRRKFDSSSKINAIFPGC